MIHQALAIRWSLVSHMMSVRPIQNKMCKSAKIAPKTKQKHKTTLHGAWWITKFARLVWYTSTYVITIWLMWSLYFYCSHVVGFFSSILIFYLRLICGKRLKKGANVTENWFRVKEPRGNTQKVLWDLEGCISCG